VNRRAQAVLLVLLGGALLRISLSGIYLRYVKAGLRPLLVCAGVMLLVAAVATIWYEWRRRRAGAGQPDPGHGHHEPGIAWLLGLVVVVLVVVSPPALGSYTAFRTGTALQRPAGFPALPAGDPLKLTVDDYAARAVYDHGRSLGRRPVELTGFISVGGHGVPYLTRLVLNCCAADARPVKVALTGQVPGDLRPDMWLQVVGRYAAKQTTDDVNHGPIPYLDVSSARTVAAPADQYES
jgi:putative membrane protein